MNEIHIFVTNFLILSTFQLFSLLIGQRRILNVKILHYEEISEQQLGIQHAHFLSGKLNVYWKMLKGIKSLAEEVTSLNVLLGKIKTQKIPKIMIHAHSKSYSLLAAINIYIRYVIHAERELEVFFNNLPKTLPGYEGFFKKYQCFRQIATVSITDLRAQARYMANFQLPRPVSRSVRNWEVMDSIVNLILNVEFLFERKCFSEEKSLPVNNLFLSNIFLNKIDIIRFGGRLSKHSSLSYYQRHPKLLPRNPEFAKKVIEYYYVTNHHAGLQLTLSLIRQKVWLGNGSSLPATEKVFKMSQTKPNIPNHPQLMKDLQATRITQIH